MSTTKKNTSDKKELSDEIRETLAYKNVQLLIEHRCSSLSDFAARIERSPSQVGAYAGPNPVKRIGNIMRKRIESAFKLPTNSLTDSNTAQFKSIVKSTDGDNEVRKGTVTTADLLGQFPVERTASVIETEQIDMSVLSKATPSELLRLASSIQSLYVGMTRERIDDYIEYPSDYTYYLMRKAELEGKQIFGASMAREISYKMAEALEVFTLMRIEIDLAKLNNSEHSTGPRFTAYSTAQPYTENGMRTQTISEDLEELVDVLTEDSPTEKADTQNAIRAEFSHFAVTDDMDEIILFKMNFNGVLRSSRPDNILPPLAGTGNSRIKFTRTHEILERLKVLFEKIGMKLTVLSAQLAETPNLHIPSIYYSNIGVKDDEAAMRSFRAISRARRHVNVHKAGRVKDNADGLTSDQYANEYIREFESEGDFASALRNMGLEPDELSRELSDFIVIND